MAWLVAELGFLLPSCGPMAAGLQHQDDPDRQKNHDDDGYERDRVEQA